MSVKDIEKKFKMTMLKTAVTAIVLIAVQIPLTALLTVYILDAVQLTGIIAFTNVMFIVHGYMNPAMKRAGQEYRGAMLEHIKEELKKDQS